MIAEMRPQIGGAPEATAIPAENGTEILEATRPAIRSCRQCFNPARPFCGFSAGSCALFSMAFEILQACREGIVVEGMRYRVRIPCRDSASAGPRQDRPGSR